jgi:CRP/FNR family transcriptional regulator, nitrogen fixation regulation protein
MQAAATTGAPQRINRDVIPFRRRIGDPPALWDDAGGRIAERPRRAFARDEAIFVEGDNADLFYRVVTGAVRTYRLLSDGRRQIDAFHLAGDVFGFEAGDRHQCSAAAICDATVEVRRRSELRSAAGDAGYSAELMKAMMRRLEQAQSHMVLLGCKNAREKVATFLLGIAARAPSVGNRVELPMLRCDIADHLGLTIETVSRTIAELARDGVIGRPGRSRTFALRDIAALRHLSR